MKRMMKTQSNQRWQSLLLVAIATVMLGASASTFAQNTANNNRFALDSLFSSTAGQNLRLQNSLDQFALTNFHANALFTANATPAFNFPKPDFSEMEQWYEIVKYEYGDPASEHILNFWVKPKVENRPHNFAMQFFDKDGVLVDPYDPRYGFGIGLDNLTPVGQTQKADVYTPRETAMKRVVSAKVVRIKQ